VALSRTYWTKSKPTSMADLPRDMICRGRLPDPDGFRDEEELFRAFEPNAWEGDRISIDAIGLPDLSVNWGKHGPAEWLLLLEVFAGCGVGAFKVGDVPKRLDHAGVYVFLFDLIHNPTETNYPHSIIRAFDENGQHILDEHRLNPQVHLRWRNRLRQRIQLRIRPAGQ
jgi:hypothetical protein